MARRARRRRPRRAASRSAPQPRPASGPAPRRPGSSCAQLGQALPDQPGDDRRDQQAMVEGRAVPPDRGDVGSVAMEQREHRRRRPAPSAARCVRQSEALRRAGDRQSDRSCRRLCSSAADDLGERREPALPAIGRSTRSGAARPSRCAASRGDRSAAPDRAGHRPAASATSRSRPGSASIPSKAAGRRDDRPRHRHRLEHLVLDAARDPERRDDDVGRGEPAAHVVDLAGDDRRAAVRQRAHLGGRDCGRR